MLFDPEEIERLTPAARIEVQDFYVRKHFADRTVVVPERRASRLARAAAMQAATAGQESAGDRRPWPRVWYRYDSSRPGAVARRG